MSNKALVSGLAPNTTYSFIVGKPGAWSKAGRFTTAKASKDPFSFIYTTDPQAQTDAMFDVHRIQLMPHKTCTRMRTSGFCVATW